MRPNAGHERAQSSVEFAVVLPLVLAVALSVVQVGLVVSAKLVTMHTAREVARAASIDPHVDPQAVADQAAPWRTPIDVSLAHGTGAGDRATVTVRVSTTVPQVFGGWVPQIEVASTVVMLAESSR